MIEVISVNNNVGTQSIGWMYFLCGFFILSILPGCKLIARDVSEAHDVKWKDFFVLKLPAESETEYKLLLSKGVTFEYSWKTDKGIIFYDLHGDPTGDTTGYFKSFKKGSASNSSGTIVSVFDGPHGWFWKNTNHHPVVVILKTKGEYTRLDLKKIETEHKSID